MANRSGLQFSLAGFPVAIPLNTLLGVGLIAWLWLPTFGALPQGQSVAAAIIFAVALLASVLLHELAHAIAARRFGFPVIGITLWAFGGFTSYRPVRNTPGREATIALAGPIVTLMIAAVLWGLLSVLPDNGSLVVEIVAASAWANTLVGVFNLLPGLPLDGGAVVTAAVWALTKSHATGQRVAAYAGMAIAAVIVAIPLLLASRSGAGPNLGFLAVSALVAGFLFVGARQALKQADARDELGDRTAMDLAVPVIVVPQATSLQDLDAILARNTAALVALVGDPATGLVGFVMPPAAAAVPAGQRAATTVTSVTRSVPHWEWLAAGTPAAYAAEVVRTAQAPVVVINVANQPVGVILNP